MTVSGHPPKRTRCAAGLAWITAFGLLLTMWATSPTSSAASSTITLKQLNNNQVEAVISGLKYPLAGVVHVITDYPTCDQTAIRGSHLPEQEDRLDFHELMSEQYERSTDSEYTYYQGGAGDWNDKNQEFRFLFPASGGNEHGYLVDQNSYMVYPPGKYLCLQVNFQDNNQFLPDYKQIALFTVTDPTIEGSDYKFTASRSAHWSVKKAGNVFDFEPCEEDITASGQASTSFTLETTESDRYSRRCVVARDSSGIQAYKLIMINPPQTEPDPPVTEPDPPEPRKFSLSVNQAESNSQITVTATVASGQDIEVKQWRYLIANSAKASIKTANDCQRLFENPPSGHVLVTSRNMTKQTPKNTASATISTSRAGHWVCIKAKEQADGIAFGYTALPEPQVDPPKPKPEPQKPAPTTPAPTPEPQPQDQAAPDPEQADGTDETSPDETPTDDAPPADEQPVIEPATAPDQTPQPGEPNPPTDRRRNLWPVVIPIVVGAGLSLTIWLVVSRRQNKRPKEPRQK